mgnify:CR=1 FL=1
MSSLGYFFVVKTVSQNYFSFIPGVGVQLMLCLVLSF